MYITEHIPSTAFSTRSITSLSTSAVVPSSIDPEKNITFMPSVQIQQNLFGYRMVGVTYQTNFCFDSVWKLVVKHTLLNIE